MKKNVVPIMCLILVAAILTTWYLGKVKWEDTEIVNQEIENTLQRKNADSIRLAQYRDTVFALNDSLIRYRTEKGYLEIELNKKKQQVKSGVNNYKQAKENKDTIRAIIEADDVFLNVLPEYLEIDGKLIQVNDSTSFIVDNLLNVKDNVINDVQAANNSLAGDLLKCQQEKAQLKHQNDIVKSDKKKNRRDKVFAGLIGGAVMFVLTLFGK